MTPARALPLIEALRDCSRNDLEEQKRLAIQTVKSQKEYITPAGLRAILTVYANGIEGNRYKVLKAIQRNAYLTPETFAYGLKMSYSSTMNQKELRKEVLKDFKRYGNLMMNSFEKAVIANLPRHVTIYRACREEEINTHCFGLSWSISGRLPRGFLEVQKSRLLVRAKIPRKRVLAFFVLEEEVITDSPLFVKLCCNNEVTRGYFGGNYQEPMYFFEDVLKVDAFRERIENESSLKELYENIKGV